MTSHFDTSQQAITRQISIPAASVMTGWLNALSGGVVPAGFPLTRVNNHATPSRQVRLLLSQMHTTVHIWSSFKAASQDGQFMDISRYSAVPKALRVTTFVRKFIDRLSLGVLVSPHLNASLVTDAEAF